MIICTSEPGSPEWHADRAGVITASMFSVVRDKLVRGANAGGYRKTAEDYAFRLAVERISGSPLDGGFETSAMRRGTTLESEARAAHEFQINKTIEPAGFITTDDGKLGATADGFIEPNGGSEYKCLVAPERIRTVLLDSNIDEFMDQMQGGMMITGRDWWHFGLYCPALAPAGKDLVLHYVERDDDYISALEADLLEFDELVEFYRAQILDCPTMLGKVFDFSNSEPDPEPETGFSAAGAFGGF